MSRSGNFFRMLDLSFFQSSLRRQLVVSSGYAGLQSLHCRAIVVNVDNAATATARAVVILCIICT